MARFGEIHTIGGIKEYHFVQGEAESYLISVIDQKKSEGYVEKSIDEIVLYPKLKRQRSGSQPRIAPKPEYSDKAKEAIEHHKNQLDEQHRQALEELKKKPRWPEHQAHLIALEELDLKNNIPVPPDTSKFLRSFSMRSMKREVHPGPLVGLKTLQKLTLCKMKVNDLDFLKPLTNLSYLDISEVHTQTNEALNSLKNLEYLEITSVPNKKPDYFAFLNALPALTVLGIHGSLYGNYSILKSPALRKLKSLTLTGTQIEDVSVLADCTALEHLDLSFNNIHDITPLASLHNLKSLNFSYNPLRNINPISALKNLTELNLDYTDIKDKNFPATFPENLNVYARININGYVLDNQCIVDSEGHFISDWPEWVTGLKPLSVYCKIRQNFYVPIDKLLSLGHSPISSFLECPNIPEHNFGREATDIDIDNGPLYWFDFDLLGRDQPPVPLRLAYCLGMADANDGMWGAFWNRSTRKKVADIMSTGDCETTIKASKELIDTYNRHNVPFPAESGEVLSIENFVYAHDTEVEKVLGIVIRESGKFKKRELIQKEWLKTQESSTDIDHVYFKDSQFEKYMLKLLQKNQGPILKKEVKHITALKMVKKSISDISGIEHFSSLTQLDLSGNWITDLTPLSGLKSLKKLIVRDNNIEGIYAL